MYQLMLVGISTKESSETENSRIILSGCRTVLTKLRSTNPAIKLPSEATEEMGMPYSSVRPEMEASSRGFAGSVLTS